MFVRLLLLIMCPILKGCDILNRNIYSLEESLDDFIDEYSKFVCNLKRLDHKGIIIGLDHNLDLLKSSKHGPTDRFLNTNLSLNLVPTITRPTWITKSTATLIDNIFISQNWLGNYDSCILIDDLSDHLPSITTIKNLQLSKKEPVTISSRDT